MAKWKEPIRATDYKGRAEAAEADVARLRRLVNLLDEQEQATTWGAAVSVRGEEIKGLRAELNFEADT